MPKHTSATMTKAKKRHQEESKSTNHSHNTTPTNSSNNGDTNYQCLNTSGHSDVSDEYTTPKEPINTKRQQANVEKAKCQNKFVISFEGNYPDPATFIKGIQQINIANDAVIKPLSHRKFFIQVQNPSDVKAVLALHNKKRIPDIWLPSDQISVDIYKEEPQQRIKNFSFIMKGVHTSFATEDILKEIRNTFPDAKAFRIISSVTGRATALIRVVTADEAACKQAIESGLNILYTHYACEAPHDKPKIVQCNKCYQMGHVSNQCENDTKCMKCGETQHMMSECARQEPKCSNCQGPHMPTSLACLVKRQEANKQNAKKKTYRDALMQKEQTESTTTDSDDEKALRSRKTKRTHKTRQRPILDLDEIAINVEQLVKIIVKVVSQTLNDIDKDCFNTAAIYDNVRSNLCNDTLQQQ